MKESDVEKYLHSEVVKLGGTTRKWVSPNYVGVPDRIVINTITVGAMIAQLSVLDPEQPFGHVTFTEVKTSSGRLSPIQQREIDRLTRHGCTVETVYGKAGVDSSIESMKLKALK